METGPDMKRSVLETLSLIGLRETQKRFAAQVRAGVRGLAGQMPSTVTFRAKTSAPDSKDSQPVTASFPLPNQVPAPQISIARRVISIFHARYVAPNFQTHRMIWLNAVCLGPHFDTISKSLKGNTFYAHAFTIQCPRPARM